MRRCVGDVRVSGVSVWSALRACLACSPLFGLLLAEILLPACQPCLAFGPSSVRYCTVLYVHCTDAALRRGGETVPLVGEMANPPGFYSPSPGGMALHGRGGGREAGTERTGERGSE